MDVHVVADDPVRESVAAHLADADCEVRDADPEAIDEARFAVVSAVVGSDVFDRANDAALAGNTPWIAVEVGGVGGHPLATIDAAVSGFAPGRETGCFACLRSRVASTTEADEERPRADRTTVRLAGAVAGRESVRVLTGDGGSVLGSALELPHARRRFFPVPGCECDDAGRDRTLSRDDDARSLEESVDRAEAAIDDRVGLITSIGEADSFPAPYYLATTAETSVYSDASAASQAAGVDDDWNAALMKAVGEALERYCAGVYREGDFVRASAEDLERAVTPADLVRPDDAPSFDSGTDYRWVPGENLASDESVHLPAAAAHFPQPGEALLPSITTGLGLGSSTVDALYSGLTEVIERDATMLAWYSSYDPLGLSVEDDGFETLARRARGEELTVTPLLVTQDVDVPVVAVAVHRADGEWPRFAVGSAADLDSVAAARSALAEALQNWMELRSLGPEDADDASGAIGEYASFPEPVREFVDVEGTVPVASVGPDPVPNGHGRLEALVSRTVDAGLTPHAAKLTTRDVDRLGFEGVRVVVPGAQPLFTGEAFFGERAETVPRELGFEPRLDRPFHPYP